LQSQDFHLFCTAGSCHPDWEIKRGELFTTTRRNASPLSAGIFWHRPKRKTSNHLKIAGRFCFSRNPSGTLFPNANPGIRGQIGGLLIGCHWPPEGCTGRPRHSVTVLDWVVYTKMHGVAQGGNRKRYLKEERESLEALRATRFWGGEPARLGPAGRDSCAARDGPRCFRSSPSRQVVVRGPSLRNQCCS
jgi:hypothetical protein